MNRLLLQIRFMPEQASVEATKADHVFYFLLGICGFMFLLVAFLITVFAIRYRRREPGQRGAGIRGNTPLELAWTLLPLGIFMIMFVWGATRYVRSNTAPDDALKVYVLGKQWMWKMWHEEGASEINELHVPVGTPVQLVMTSEDVIHSYFLPAFRIKNDVVPGRYTSIWFNAVRPGKYHLFCAEYCGTNHSRMIGRVHVLEPAEYSRWLQGGTQGGTMATAGERVFLRFGCPACHVVIGGVRAPHLEGLLGREVRLASGETIVADEDYIRRSILDPKAQVVAGYEPVMPSYKDQISEEQLLLLIEYVESLSNQPRTTTP